MVAYKCVSSLPPAIKNRQSHANDAQNKPSLIKFECKWDFKIQVLVT